MDDHPNERDDTLIVDESTGSSSNQPDDQIADGNGDDGRQAEQLVENTAIDQAAVEAEVTSSRPTRQRQPPAYMRSGVPMENSAHGTHCHGAPDMNFQKRSLP